MRQRVAAVDAVRQLDDGPRVRWERRECGADLVTGDDALDTRRDLGLDRIRDQFHERRRAICDVGAQAT